MQKDRKFITLKNLMFSSSQDPTTGGTGKPVEVFSSQNRLKKEIAACLKGTLQNSEAEFRDEHTPKFELPRTVSTTKNSC